jgi:hypothetical protein
MLLLPPAPAVAKTDLAWQPWLPGLAAAVDVGGPLADGALVIANGGGWVLVHADGAPEAFGPPLLGQPPGPWDIAVSPGQAVAGSGCVFPPGHAYALVPGSPVEVLDGSSGAVRALASFPGLDSPAGIALDRSGRFGGRLLVAGSRAGQTVVDAVDCAGRVTAITGAAPPMEGGMAVAPATFGTFGGRLLGADDSNGEIVAVSAEGTSEMVARSGLPSGHNVGAESVGFVPPGFAAGGTAYLAGGRGIFRLNSADLVAAGVADGDLLVANSAGGSTVDVRCAANGSCRVNPVVGATPGVQAEGHLILVAVVPGPSPPALPEAVLGAAGRGGLSVYLPYAVGIAILTPLFLLYRRRQRRR